MPGQVINLEQAGWKRLSEEEQRRADAMSAFERSEKARERLHSIAKFWMTVAGASLALVVVLFLVVLILI